MLEARTIETYVTGCITMLKPCYPLSLTKNQKKHEETCMGTDLGGS